MGGILLLELIFSFANYDIISNVEIKSDQLQNNTNTHIIGKVLYTDYFFVFQVSGCILLVAMIGAIVLTLRKREGVLRQDIEKQLTRNKSEALEIVDIKKR